MTYEKIREILLDMGIFKIRGTMSPPNNRVIFERKPLRIIVTPKESEIKYDHWTAWSFTLNGLTIKELFVMLDDYFPQPSEDEFPSWSDVDFGTAQDWINFKNKWSRNEKLETLL